MKCFDKNKNIFRIALATVFILLMPFSAMQFTSEVNWDETDFVVAGALIFGTGIVFDRATAKVKNPFNRFVVGAVILIAFLLIWAELAVGIFKTPFAGD